MKKLLVLSLALSASAVIFSSCKKDHTCSCKDSDGEVIGKYTYKATKKKAEDSCEGNNATLSAGGSGVKCELD